MRLPRPSFVTSLLVLALVTAGGGVAWQWREGARLRAELAGLHVDPDEAARVRAENERLRAGQPSAAQLALLRDDRAALLRLRDELGRLRAQLEPPAARTRPPDASVASTRERAVLAGAEAAIPRRVEERYVELFARLNFSPEARERLLRLLIARDEALLEQTRAAVRRGESPNAEELRDRALKAQERLAAQIATEFGAAAAAEYRAHEWRLSAESMIAVIEQRRDPGLAPLSPEQRTQLTAILLERAEPGFPGRVLLRTYLPPYSYYAVAITDETIAAAARILSPAQLHGLRVLQAQQQKSPPR